MGMTGAKGSTASSTSTISRATRVLTYRFNGEISHRGGRWPCVKLPRWFLYLRGECYFNQFRSGKQTKINTTCRLAGDANEILALLHTAVSHSFSVPRSGSFVTSPFADTFETVRRFFLRLRSAGTAGVVRAMRFGERLSHDVGAPIVAYQLHTV